MRTAKLPPVIRFMIGRAKVFVDTNVLIYARDPRVPEKRATAIEWLSRLGDLAIACVNLQVLNEMTRWMLARNPPSALELIREEIEVLRSWGDKPVDGAELEMAWAIRAATGYQWFDCLLLAAAENVGCSHFVSEDMDSGRLVGSVRIIDPFTTSLSDVLPQH